MRRIAVIALTALALLAPAPARADERSITDPDDTPGLLDIRRVSLMKPGPADPLRIEIEVYEGGGLRTLTGSFNRLIVIFDADGDGSRDFRGRVQKVNRRFVLELTGQGSAFEPLRVRRLNARTLRLTIPGSSPMNPDGATTRIHVRSRFVGSHECDTASGAKKPCLDRAPNGGWA